MNHLDSGAPPCARDLKQGELLQHQEISDAGYEVALLRPKIRGDA